MTLSTPLLAAVPLVAGLLGPALVGAAPAPGHAGPAASAGPARRSDVVEHVAARSSEEERRVLAYWTPERMAAALPIGLLATLTKGGLLDRVTGGRDTVLPSLGSGHGPVGLGDGGPSASGGERAPSVPGGGPGPAGLGGGASLPGPAGHGGARYAPGRYTPGRSSPSRGDARPAAEPGAPRGSAHAAPSARTPGSPWMTGGAVARTTGRVFLTVAGADFVCSASTVRSANKDLVVTAGHCVKDGAGAWAENWTFVPGYGLDGDRPYGQYAARRMFVAGPWSRSADDNHDVAMVVLSTWSGRHVTDVVGAQDIGFNAGRGGQAFGFGYPADPPYDGEHLVYCAGRLRDDPYKQTRDQGLGCDMTAGSSGGPWLTGFDPATGQGTITSLSSFKYSDDHRTMYGPYLGDTAKALYQAAQDA
ncbi:trypsin-like serine peptidase [Nonomuraea pusilla]|uniref:V8-like Glu-specific endopeptidase n=1 Tax=Nonomuraea pusilla TaxID=46177 RepID=A0A1H7RRM5_9ACTN|nr:trypsin-like serine protease [Nonomuraea pusilla]SEL62853.1 V8-like Glu-specific endopeptidase [Nonomuraea pusilla]